MFIGLGSHKIWPKIVIFGQKLRITCDFQRAVIPGVLIGDSCLIQLRVRIEILYHICELEQN